jgi:hypothetical protein
LLRVVRALLEQAPAGSIQCEYVSVDDHVNMLRLCLALAAGAAKMLSPIKALRASWKGRDLQAFFRIM